MSRSAVSSFSVPAISKKPTFLRCAGKNDEDNDDDNDDDVGDSYDVIDKRNDDDDDDDYNDGIDYLVNGGD